MKDENANIIGTARLTIIGQASGRRKKQHKGKVLVESEIGKGTTFAVQLPLKWRGSV